MNDKQRVAEHAAQLVEHGMLIGLGTGSTASGDSCSLPDILRARY